MISISAITALSPAHYSRETFGFNEEKIAALMDSIYERGDRLMKVFLLIHCALAVILASYYRTWVVSFVVAGAATGMFFISATLLPRSLLTRCIAGLSLQTFCALHIYQMHGLAEMHFFFFTAFTMMIVYQDWRAMWPGTLLIIVQHTWSAVLAANGTNLGFWDRDSIGVTTLTYHLGIALAQVGICNYWCVILRHQTLREAFQQEALVESRNHIEDQLDRVLASETSLQHRTEDLQKIQKQLESDIAERKRVEAAQRASEERFRTLVAATSQIVWTTSPTGEFTTEQPSWSAFTGQNFVQYEGWNWLHAIHPEDQMAVANAWRNALARRGICEVEYRLRRSDGVYRYMAVRAVPVLEADGSVREWVGVDDDVTERKTVEAEILRAKEAAEGANRSKSQFLANMSHELRTPLNAVIGYSEMLMEEAEEDGNDHFAADLGKIRGAGRHLLTLINDILDLSKIEAGKMELFLETFDIAPLLADVTATLTPLAEKKHNHIVVSIAPDLGGMRSDMVKLRQCLFNLISNACKFTEEGTVTLSAKRQQGGRRDEIIFEVRDTGIGMNEAQRARLFEPFQQADASTTRKFGGTGLGLAITARFCAMLGGRITVDSTPGQGSVFTLRLPTQLAAPEGESPAPSREDNVDLSELGSRNVIVVIDDDATARDLMQRYLNREGFTILTAAGGEEGLRLARKVRPVAITLDVMMPEMDGWTTLSALKSDPDLSDIPVIMLTIVGDRNRGFALGATDYMTKPVQWEQLTAMLEKHRCDGNTSSVLLVEDDPATREMLRTMLEKQGWDVSEALNGREGLERIEEQRPDVILLDLMMPEMDGFAFARTLHDSPDRRNIPIIVLTAKDLAAEEREMLSGYVERILQKEMTSSEDLMAEVRQMVVDCVQRGSKSTRPC